MDEEGVGQTGASELERIISEIETSTAGTDLGFLNTLRKKSEETQSTEARENTEILDMRKQWARWVLIFIGIIIIFDIILVTFYGLGTWEFKNPNVVIAIITENFLKIMSLGILITTNLFVKIFKKS